MSDAALNVALAVFMGLCSTVFWFWTRQQVELRKDYDRQFTDLKRRIGNCEDTSKVVIQLHSGSQEIERRVGVVDRRLDHQAQRSSDHADKIMVKMNDVDHRLVMVEARLSRLSP